MNSVIEEKRLGQERQQGSWIVYPTPLLIGVV